MSAQQSVINEAIRDESVRRDICGIVSEFESALSEIDSETLDNINHKIWVEMAERQDMSKMFLAEKPF